MVIIQSSKWDFFNGSVQSLFLSSFLSFLLLQICCDLTYKDNRVVKSFLNRKQLKICLILDYITMIAFLCQQRVRCLKVPVALFPQDYAGSDIFCSPKDYFLGSGNAVLMLRMWNALLFIVRTPPPKVIFLRDSFKVKRGTKTPSGISGKGFKFLWMDPSSVVTSVYRRIDAPLCF